MNDTVITIKRREAKRRMSAIKQAKRNPRVAEKLQRRASIFSNARDWRIMNLSQIFDARA